MSWLDYGLKTSYNKSRTAIVILFLLFVLMFANPFINFDVTIHGNVTSTNKLLSPNKSYNVCSIYTGWYMDNTTTPLLKLNQSRYLLPILKNGPNNQLSGLRDAVYLCIKLNRTLVLPKFYKHRTDTDPGLEVNQAHRIDIRHFRKLISFVTYDEFRLRCHGNINAVFRVRNVSITRYRSYEDRIHMKILQDKHNLRRDVIEYPVNPQLMKKRILSLEPRLDVVKRYYGSEIPCAIYAEPFGNIQFNHYAVEGEEPKVINTTDDPRLYTQIVRFTKPPPHVADMTSSFIYDVIKSDYVTVHWRYDKSDWMSSCNNQRANANRMKLCDKIRSITPDDVSDGIIRGIDDVINRCNCNVIHNVYIASPPSQYPLMTKLQQILHDRHNVTMHYGKHLHDYILHNFGQCSWLRQNFNDILSTIEMQLCINSKVFYRATASSWSNNVVMLRQRQLFDRPFLSLIKNL